MPSSSTRHLAWLLSGSDWCCHQACKFVEENLAISVEKLGKDTLLNVAKTAMSSKIIGADSDFYAKLAVDAMLSVRPASSCLERSMSEQPATHTCWLRPACYMWLSIRWLRTNPCRAR